MAYGLKACSCHPLSYSRKEVSTITIFFYILSLKVSGPEISRHLQTNRQCMERKVKLAKIQASENLKNCTNKPDSML